MQASQLITMTVEQWIAVPDNPRQRNTHARLARAKKYLSQPSALHNLAMAARLPDGSLVKIDGHTRAELWRLGAVGRPAMVNCYVVDVQSLEEAAALYWQVDTADSAKHIQDYLEGALRHCGKTIQQGWLYKTIPGALVMIERPKGPIPRHILAEALPAWWSEIVWLDQYEMPPLFARTAVTAALLLRAGKESTATFIMHLPDGGSRQNGASDAIHALTRTLELMAAQGRTHAWKSRLDIAGKVLAALDAWDAGRSFKGGIRGYQWLRAIQPHRRLKTE